MMIVHEEKCMGAVLAHVIEIDGKYVVHTYRHGESPVRCFASLDEAKQYCNAIACKIVMGHRS